MQLHYFRAIANNSDFRHLLLDGDFIGERETEGCPVLLFQIGVRYVELVLEPKGTDVLGSRDFTDTDELEPYLSHVSVPQLPK